MAYFRVYPHSCEALNVTNSPSEEPQDNIKTCRNEKTQLVFQNASPTCNC